MRTSLVVLAFVLVLPGCPWRVDPPTPEVCPSRVTCQTCATDPNCGWAERSCWAADHAPSAPVRSPEGCPEPPLDQRAPETAP